MYRMMHGCGGSVCSSLTSFRQRSRACGSSGMQYGQQQQSGCTQQAGGYGRQQGGQQEGGYGKQQGGYGQRSRALASIVSKIETCVVSSGW